MVLVRASVKTFVALGSGSLPKVWDVVPVRVKVSANFCGVIFGGGFFGDLRRLLKVTVKERGRR